MGEQVNEIPNSAARSDRAVNFCGKLSPFCGKPQTSLWKRCGMFREKLEKK